MGKQIIETEAPDSLNATTKEVVEVKEEKEQTYKVKKTFLNDVTRVVQEPGDEITVSDPDRLQNLKEQGLI